MPEWLSRRTMDVQVDGLAAITEKQILATAPVWEVQFGGGPGLVCKVSDAARAVAHAWAHGVAVVSEPSVPPCQWCGRAIHRVSAVPGMPQWATYGPVWRSDCEGSDDGLHDPGEWCVCGGPRAPGVIHRQDGPCYVAAPAPLCSGCKKGIAGDERPVYVGLDETFHVICAPADAS